MEVVIPERVMRFTAPNLYDVDGKQLQCAYYGREGPPKRYKVPSVFFTPKDKRNFWQRKRGVKRKRSEGNPVLHIKALDDYYTPALENSQHRIWDGKPIVIVWSYSDYVVKTRVDVGQSPQLYWSDGNTGGVPIVCSAQLLWWPQAGGYAIRSYTRQVYDVTKEQWHATGHYLTKPLPDQVILTGTVGASELMGAVPDRWDWEGDSGWTKYGATTTFHCDVDVAAIIQRCQDEMLRSLRYNELQLYSESAFYKHQDLSWCTPYGLQVALGDAFDRACQSNPTTGNPGIPTIGFNNLQNLDAVISGFKTLALGKAGGFLDALQDMRSVRSSREEVMERLISIGRKSRYRMTHDPDWLTLTPAQQRRLIRRTELSSVVNVPTADVLIPSTADLPDYFPEQPWAGDLWLQGRYVWSTSWSDADQAYRYFWYKMQQFLGQQTAIPSLHGLGFVLNPETGDHDAVVHCTFNVRDRTSVGYAKMWHEAYIAGMLPTSSVIWDFVPFSFVADWFFPISDSLEMYDRRQFFDPLYYDFTNICCSVKYTSTTNLGFKVQCYTRWYQENVPSVECGHVIWDGGRTPSSKTVSFRTIDGVFLLIRR